MDWAVLCLILVIAIGGIFRGTVRQAFSLIGLVAGVWVVVWVARWVGQHWLGARPAMLFGVLRWMIAVLAGLTAASLLQWLGERLAQAVHATPLGWVDRLGGLAVGTLLGIVTAGAVLVAMMLVGWPPEVAAAARGSRLGEPALIGAQRVCALGERVLPGSTWLARRIEAVRRERHPVTQL